MRTFKRALGNLFTKSATSETEKVYRDWDYMRSKALGPSDLAEIDAIFSRHLGR